MNRRALGRGLSALLGTQVDDPLPDALSADTSASDTVVEVPLAQVDPNPYQPRSAFEPADLDALAESIRLHGLLQPIVVRRHEGRYQLVAGERRLRAAEQLRLASIPARVVELDERQTCELALVENLQRADLNAIEKASAFQRYIEQFHSTHEDLARQLGIDRSTVTNLLRLLDLPDAVQEMVAHKKLSGGHARALLSLDDPLAQLAAASDVVEQDLSVRQTEALVRERKKSVDQAAMPSADPPPSEPADEKTNHVRSIENELCQRLGMKVAIHAKGTKGQIVLHFSSNDDFERALDQLRR